MTHLTIDNKKYVLLSEENYQELQKIAALKREPEKTFSIEEARKNCFREHGATSREAADWGGASV